MQCFTEHIENLLIQNDFVTIPDFGGFVVKNQPAKLIGTKIIPPTSIIVFNPQMNNNDGLLALEIAHTENISYREAVKIINKEVNLIKNKLHEKGQFEFGKLGILFNMNQSVIFEPTDKSVFLPINFGLKPIGAHKLPVHNNKITISFQPRQILQYAAVLLILLGIFVFSPQLGDTAVSDYASLVPKIAFIQQATETKLLPENEIKDISIHPTEQTQKKYHVVVCCLADKTSAEKYCNLLKSKHYENAHVLPSIKTNRIIIESFSVQEEALAFMKNLRSANKQFKDAWLHYENSQY